MFLCGTDSWEDVPPTTNIWISSRLGSTVFYLTYPHNMQLLLLPFTPLQQPHCLTFDLEWHLDLKLSKHYYCKSPGYDSPDLRRFVVTLQSPLIFFRLAVYFVHTPQTAWRKKTSSYGARVRKAVCVSFWLKPYCRLALRICGVFLCCNFSYIWAKVCLAYELLSWLLYFRELFNFSVFFFILCLPVFICLLYSF